MATGYLNELLFNLPKAAEMIRSRDPSSHDWSVHQMVKIDGVFRRHGAPSERSNVGITWDGNHADNEAGRPERELFYIAHHIDFPSASLRWTYYLHEGPPARASVQVALYPALNHEQDVSDRWTGHLYLSGADRRWTLDVSPPHDRAQPFHQQLMRACPEYAALVTRHRTSWAKNTVHLSKRRAYAFLESLGSCLVPSSHQLPLPF